MSKALLANIGRVLRDAERFLPTPMGQHADACEDWCKYWMLLVGSWYSLHNAEPFLQDEELRFVLPQAHDFAIVHLDSLIPQPIPTTANPNPWFAGYFLISAEHRLADFLDRATKSALDGLALSDCGVHARREALRTGCPRCRYHVYPGELQQALAKESPLVVLYTRVNVIKHDAPEKTIDDLSTRRRWSDASDALLGAGVVLRELSRHHVGCSASGV